MVWCLTVVYYLDFGGFCFVDWLVLFSSRLVWVRLTLFVVFGFGCFVFRVFTCVVDVDV